jgi:hypothetical protein
MNPVDFDSLTKRLAVWLAPEDIIRAVNSLAKNPTAASKASSLILLSPTLQSTADGGLALLCKEYLHRFCVPATLISLLKNIQPSNSLDYAWTQLENARFAGTIEPPKPRAAGQLNAVLQITDKDFLIDILVQPLKGLQGMVASAAETWREAKNGGLSPRNIIHMHRMPEPFAVWLDAYVAGQYGFTEIGTAAWLEDSNDRLRKVGRVISCRGGTDF